jgi:hypothetical protein
MKCGAARRCKETAMRARAADAWFRQNMPVCRQKSAGIWQREGTGCRYGGSGEEWLFAD